MASFRERAFFFRGYAQALFFLVLTFYVGFSPPDIFEGTWFDTSIDGAAIALLVLGESLRVWAVSHAGKCTRSRRLKASRLVTSGPYVHIRHPIYSGNFLIGLGMVLIAEAFFFVPIFLVLFGWYYHTLVSVEEEFLKGRFGEEYARYCRLVPKYVPRFIPVCITFSLGKHFPLKEFGTALGVLCGAFFFEWIEFSLHREWIVGLFERIAGRVP